MPPGPACAPRLRNPKDFPHLSALNNPPQCSLRRDNDGQWALLTGSWGAAELGRRAQWRRLRAQLADAKGDDLGWNLEGLDWLDHVGAQLLWNHWGRRLPARLAASDAQRAMLDRVARFSKEPAPPPARLSLLEHIDSLGCLVINACGHFAQMTRLIGQLLIDLAALCACPAPGALARHLRPSLLHGRHGPAHHGPGGLSDRRGAGLPDGAAAAPVRG